MEQSPAGSHEPLVDSAPAAATGRRRIGISTICVGLVTLCALIFVMVPARFEDSLGLLRFQHGWPFGYLERAALRPIHASDFWRLTDRVQSWSPIALVADVLCAATIVAVAAYLFERWRRRPQRFALSLRGAFVGLALLSVLMFTGARWVARQRELAELASMHGWGRGFVGPMWLDHWLRAPRGYSTVDAEDFYPSVLLGVSDAYVTVPPTPVEAPASAQALALQRIPERFVLVLDFQYFDLWQAGSLDLYHDCRHVHVMLARDQKPPFPPLMASLPNLETVDLSNIDHRVDAKVICEALESIANPTRIRALRIDISRQTVGEFFRAIERFVSLNNLELKGHGGGYDWNDGLSRLATLPHLERLQLSMAIANTPLNLSESLLNFSRLQCLELKYFRMDVGDVELLGQMKGLKFLNLSGCHLSALAFKRLGELRHLKYLNANDMSVDERPCTQAELDWLESQLPFRVEY